MLSTTQPIRSITTSRSVPNGRVHQQAVQSQRPVQFGGAGDLVSGFIGYIDKSRAAELVTSDGLGMLAPRVTVSAAFRGADDARETLIREGAGLLCVAMLAGLTNRFMVWGLGNGVNVYNPHGTPARAWINAKNMRVLSNRYSQALHNPSNHSAEAVRTEFLTRILNDLESGDRRLSVAGQLKNLKATQGMGSEKAAQVLMRQLPDASMAGDIQTRFQSGSAESLKTLQEDLLKAGWGKLSNKGKTDLAQKYALNGDLQSIDQQAWSQVSHLSGSEQQKAFLKKRLHLSLQDLKNADSAFIKSVDQLALDQGLTQVVNLAGDKESALKGVSRETFFKELKYFLQHYADRATHQAERQADSGWRKATQEALFATKSNGFKRLWPQAEDGLVSAMLKAKMGYTWVPIAVAIAANGITTFLNNYVTQKKYGGKVFFPGEESAVSGGGMHHPFQKGAQV